MRPKVCVPIATTSVTISTTSSRATVTAVRATVTAVCAHRLLLGAAVYEWPFFS